MNIRVDIGGRDFEGYLCSHYRVSVRYQGHIADGDWIDFERHPDFLEQLSSILLGQRSPVDIAGHSETYVHTGETIARLHIKAIAENWGWIDLTKTPWAERIADLKHRYAEAALKRDLTEGRLDIRVWFTYLSGGNQRSGSFTISRDVARWLGEQLVALANGSSSADGATVEVKNDRELTAVQEGVA